MNDFYRKTLATKDVSTCIVSFNLDSIRQVVGVPFFENAIYK